MDWIDFNIICIGQCIPKRWKSELFLIDLMNLNPNKTHKCYSSVWDIMNHIKGIWYEIWSKDKDADLFDSTYEMSPCYELPIGQPEAAPHGWPIVCQVPRSEMEDILRFYINHSPVRKIIVLLRHQGYEKERYHGLISLNEFLERLYANNIYGNVAYFISDENVQLENHCAVSLN